MGRAVHFVFLFVMHCFDCSVKEEEHDDYKAIMIKALADRLAEALAEYLHKKTRTEYWGYSKNEQLNTEDLLKCKYAGVVC